MSELKANEWVEITITAGEEGQFSNAISGAAESLGLTGVDLEDVQEIGDGLSDVSDPLANFQQLCWSDFLDSHGSDEEWGETSGWTWVVKANEGS